MRLSTVTHTVITGLDPAIQFLCGTAMPAPAWIAGSSPAMTDKTEPVEQ
jgi:hypothetical protein